MYMHAFGHMRLTYVAIELLINISAIIVPLELIMQLSESTFLYDENEIDHPLK